MRVFYRGPSRGVEILSFFSLAPDLHLPADSRHVHVSVQHVHRTVDDRGVIERWIRLGAVEEGDVAFAAFELEFQPDFSVVEKRLYSRVLDHVSFVSFHIPLKNYKMSFQHI